jgi:hypothetical protein
VKSSKSKGVFPLSTFHFPLSTYLLRALPLGVALLLYGYSVRLPFFIDDGLHFAMIKDYPAAFGVPGVRFWGGAISFPYYRPFVFSVWEAEQMRVGGHFDPFALHLLNVLCFGLAGGALGRVTERLTGSALAGVIAGLTFVLFPFSYAAVILVAALFHILLALFSALTLLFALAWLDGKRARLSLVLCWLCAFGAVFSHENGVLALPLLVGMIALTRAWRAMSLRRTAVLLLPIGAIIAVYLYLWATVPRANDAPRLMETVLVSLGIMLQGLVYPFVALTRWLTCGMGTCAHGDTALLWALAAGVVGVMLVVVWRHRGHKTEHSTMHPYTIAAYGVVWYVLGALPSALLLSPDYISGSPRLMMFSSFGAGMFWGAVVAAAWQNSPQRHRGTSSVYLANFASWWFRILCLVIVAAGVFVSVRFLNARRVEALTQSAYTWELLRLVERDQPSAPLVINAPAFLAPTETNRTFLAGAEGVVFMVEYVNYNQQFWAMTGVEFPRVEALAHNPTLRSTSEVVYAPYQTVGQGTFQERLLNASHIYATLFDGQRFYPVYVGSPNTGDVGEPIATFDASLTLTQADATYQFATNTVLVTTRWRVETPLPAKPFVHVVCEGVLVGQWDGAVWGETYPFSQWSAGETQTDVRPIRLSQAVTEACLQVFVGAYWEADGVRLQAADAATGEHLRDDVWVAARLSAEP